MNVGTFIDFNIEEGKHTLYKEVVKALVRLSGGKEANVSNKNFGTVTKPKDIMSLKYKNTGKTVARMLWDGNDISFMDSNIIIHTQTKDNISTIYVNFSNKYFVDHKLQPVYFTNREDKENLQEIMNLINALILMEQ